MNEYVRQPNGKIQSDFALRAGRLIEQYENLSAHLPDSERYEATLVLCIIQSILVNCTQLISELKKGKKTNWDSSIQDAPPFLGIRRSFVVENTFPGEVTYEKFIEHVRNALCHPTIAEKKPNLRSTGFTTIEKGSGLIEKFSFIDSPWVDRGKLLSKASCRSKDKVELFAKEFFDKHGFELVVKSNTHTGNYEIFHGDEKDSYYPLFIAEMSADELKSLALELANYLAYSDNCIG